jgi:hypothetical protein
MTDRCYAMAPCYTLHNLSEPANDTAQRIDAAVEQQMTNLQRTFYIPLPPGEAQAAFQMFVQSKSRVHKKKFLEDIKTIATQALHGTNMVIEFASLADEQVAHKADLVSALMDRVLGPSTASLNANRVAREAWMRQQHGAEVPRLERMRQGLTMTVCICAKDQNFFEGPRYTEDPNGWRKYGLGMTVAELGNKLCSAAKSLAVAADVRVAHTDASLAGHFFQVKLFIKTNSSPTKNTWNQVAHDFSPFLL